MTSQLFKPNLGLEPSTRGEKGASEAGQDREKAADEEKVEELQSPSSKITSLPLAESRRSIRFPHLNAADLFRQPQRPILIAPPRPIHDNCLISLISLPSIPSTGL